MTTSTTSSADWRTAETALAIAWLALLGAVLIWTRLVGLDQSLQHDEAFAVDQYIVPGPSGILFGSYEPNDHVLFNLLTWATTLGIGRSEALYRLWAALPGLAAAGLLVWWSWRRLGLWTAVVVGFLVVTSPIQLELLKQARGYGLTALAAVVMLVAADRFVEGRSTRWLVLWGVAAAAGTYTHPAFAFGVVAQAAVLGIPSETRRRVAAVSAAVAVALVVAYAPLLDQMVGDFSKYYAARGDDRALQHALPPLAADDLRRPPVNWYAPVTGPGELVAPLTELVATGDTRPSCELNCYIGKNFLRYSAIPLLLAAAGALLLWLRGRRTLMLLMAVPTLLPFVLAAIGRVDLQNRFVSYLIPYLFVMMAVAIVAGVRAVAVSRAAAIVGIAAISAFGLFALSRFTDLNSRWTAVPWEDAKQVGAIVNNANVERVLTNSRRPTVLVHYIGAARLEDLSDPAALNQELCAAPERLAYIQSSGYGATPADTTCLRRRGVKTRVNQRGRGGGFDIWLLNSQAAQRR
jgi:hypothetical protein